MNTNKAAPGSIILPYYGFAAMAFLLLTILMFVSADSFIGHYFNPHLLAITHTATLGWGTMIIFGALYQFLPVILGTELYSLKLARGSFILFALGIILLIYSFWNFAVGLPLQIAAMLILFGSILFTWNVIGTFNKVKESNTEGDFVVASCIWFCVTVLIGTLMTFNFTLPFLPKDHLYYLKIHAHVGIAGWFLLLIIGVSSRLVPMFLLSSSVSKNRLKYSYYIINAALLAFLADSFIFNGVQRGLIYFILVITGMAFYISYLLIVYRKRGRKIIDISMKQSLLAFVLISIPVISGIIIQCNLITDTKFLMQIILTYGTSIFMGFISLLIMGKTFKTLPFIVWLKLSKDPDRKLKVPLPKDLFSTDLVKWQFVFFAVGFSLLIIAILTSIILLIKVACLIMIVSALLYNINVFRLIFYKVK